jgi:hypothetical protein
LLDLSSASVGGENENSSCISCFLATASASCYRFPEDVGVHAVIVAELDLDNRHKGQSLGNKPDRQCFILVSFPKIPSDLDSHRKAESSHH